MAVTCVIAVATYPLAYRRRTRYLVEGAGAFNSRNLAVVPVRRLLHATLLRNPVQRGIYHFISYSLLRIQRHRVYLAMYGGLGLALLTACAVLLKFGHGGLRFALSPDGVRAAVPIVAFWTTAGLRTAFLSPTDQRGNWIFRVILGKPGVSQLQTARLWIVPCALVLTLGMVTLIELVGQPQMLSWKTTMIQALVTLGLCVLLADALFLKVTSLPFTGYSGAPATNLAFTLLLYAGLFPPLVLLTNALVPWLASSMWHVVLTAAITFAAHLAMRSVHRKNAEYYASLIDLDDGEEEFPQRLGLR